MAVDDWGDTSIGWRLFDANDIAVGGVYTTHAGAAQTWGEFPAYFASVVRIAPVVSYRTGHHGRLSNYGTTYMHRELAAVAPEGNVLG